MRQQARQVGRFERRETQLGHPAGQPAEAGKETGDGGLAVNASLKLPQGVTVGSDGAVYIGDSGNDRVLKIVTE